MRVEIWVDEEGHPRRLWVEEEDSGGPTEAG
jgi:hypothetical protein